MAVTSQPALYVNGRNLNNWFSSEILWKQTEGLFDGAALEPGATLDTFDGKAKVRAHALAYQARRVVITGRILNRSGWLDKQRAIADLADVFAGRPATVRLGTLELECEFGPVKLVDDQYSHLPGYQTWRVEGEAIPGTYASQYHTALGADQGLAVQDDRPDSSATKFTSNSFTYTNPGTAPTEAVVSLTGTASTTYYLKGEGLRRVPMTTDASGNASIDEASGFYLKSGANAIRVEDSAGALASGVTAVSLYGTKPRYLGNAPTTASTQSSTTNRMSEGPMLTPARTGSATYISTAGTLTTATDGQARIGLPYVVRRNLVPSSEDLIASSWVKNRSSVSANATAGPLSGSLADKVIEDTTTGNHLVYKQALSVTAAAYTGSVYAKQGERSVAVIYFYDGAAAYYAYFNLATGATLSKSAGLTTTITAENGYYRCSATITFGGATSSAEFGYGVAQADGVVGYTGNGTSGAFFYGGQFEAGSLTPYQATNASGVDVSSPVNGAGLVLEGAGTNLLLWSQAIENAAWVAQAGVTKGGNVADPWGGTAALSIAFGAGSGSVYQQSGTAAASSTFTGSVWLRVTSGTLAGRLIITDLSTQDAVTKSVTLTTAWQRFDATGAFSGAGSNAAFAFNTNGVAATIEATGGQLERNPFVTSYIPTTTATITRNADLCGIVSPHNLLQYSQQIDTSGGVWTSNGQTGALDPGPQDPSGAYSSYKLAKGVGSNSTDQVTATACAGKTLTYSVWLKAGIANYAELQIISTTGAVSSYEVCNLTSEWKRYKITHTFASSDAGYAKVRIWVNRGGASGDTAYAWGAQLVEGSHPGPYVRTTDTAIPAPTSPALDPAWHQNGRLKVRILPPSISTGKTYLLLGSEDPSNPSYYAGTCRIYRAGSLATNDYTLTIDRKHNASTGFGGIVGRALLSSTVNVWDGAAPEFELIWKNYTADGVRSMPMELWIDDTLVASQDVAALYGATEWAEIDPSKLVSDGNTYATLSDLELGYPEIPANAIPAT